MRHLIFALSCLALGAGPPQSSAAGLSAWLFPATGGGGDTSRVQLGPARGGTTAYVVWPASTGPAPAVIVVHEWWGLNGQIRSVARRLAQEGYVAIVPDLYRGRVADEAEDAHELSRGLDEKKAVGDLQAAAAWLRSQRSVNRARIGALGFCMGGRLSELFALRDPGLAAVVMFYGQPETDVAQIATLRAPLQAHFGEEDRGIGADQVQALQAALAKAGKVADIHVYSGAGHAFMHEGRPSYHADAAKLAWARTLQFFQKHLKG